MCDSFLADLYGFGDLDNAMGDLNNNHIDVLLE
jgi:hypothetical protein